MRKALLVPTDQKVARRSLWEIRGMPDSGPVAATAQYEVKVGVRRAAGIACKTVGSGFPGSNPGPAATTKTK